MKTCALPAAFFLLSQMMPLQAQGSDAALPKEDPVKVNLLFVGWYHLEMNNNVRNNVPSTPAYYKNNVFGDHKDNSFALHRTEIYINGKITKDLSGTLIMVPNYSNEIIRDALLTWKPTPHVEAKVGQFKPVGYEATLVAAADIYFTDRGQLARMNFGTDVRQRGLLVSYQWGDPSFNAKLGAGIFNGAPLNKNDSNPYKDYVIRADFDLAKQHQFGVYGQVGQTDASEIPYQQTAFFTGTNPPTAQQIWDNKDKTSTYGAYYAFNHAGWHFDTEVATGDLGRRYQTFNTNSAKREHLDQKFLSVSAIGAYQMNHHIFRARYDHLNMNQGNKWYTAHNPYTHNNAGIATGNDYTPKYTEITAGYTYAFCPDNIRKANIKLDYIWRSKNFLQPRQDQSGAQGADSIVAAIQFWL